MFDPDLILFRHIVAQGSLAAAGRVLGISAPMVSKRLSRLEQRLGAPLLRRTTRRLALTPAGERFHADLTALSVAAEEAEARLRGSASMPRGPLRISVPTSLGRLYVAPALPAFLDQYPEVRVELHLSDDYVDLIAAGFDLALRITTDVGAGLEAEKLAANRRVLCAAPAYLRRHGTPQSVAELATHHLLAAEGQFPWKLARPGQSWSCEGTSRVLTNSSEAVRELALAGAGIALRSLWDVGEDLSQGRLIRVLPEIAGSASAAMHLVKPRAALMPEAVRAYSEHLRALFRDADPVG